MFAALFCLKGRHAFSVPGLGKIKDKYKTSN